ncbi:circadian clock KaiB family protein [Dyadobacter subterraneus]|uniref:Circadian clock KaiB family protein n=1 Tax=Dyadobacter subterraneus TaxID=2773304 RepID=A0ABR9W9K1_9BACT|nr:circadian clock KaiB family protein [Dyadobacter subterraneus]MBE9462164.1 circadian clock KaiB family protein [Dyadobacter subterraneus]
MSEIRWKFKLYTFGNSHKSITAFENLKLYCKNYQINYEIEVIDLRLSPQLAERDSIVVIPTLVRLAPSPAIKLIGDLSDEQKVVKLLKVV